MKLSNVSATRLLGDILLMYNIAAKITYLQIKVKNVQGCKRILDSKSDVDYFVSCSEISVLKINIQ